MRLERVRAIFAKIPRWILTSIIVLIAMGVLWGGWIWTMNMGRDAATKLAIDSDLCSSGECQESVANLLQVVAEEYKMEPTTIQWCLGVDELAAVKVRRGGLIKTIMVDIMYWPCGALFVDGEPE